MLCLFFSPVVRGIYLFVKLCFLGVVIDGEKIVITDADK